jgi:muramoyltetrapeptide carboxypeptidase
MSAVRPFGKPARLHRGDRVAIVSPSFPAVDRWPHRAERGVAYLEGLGLEVRMMANAARSGRWVAGSASERVDDLHAAFADPEIKAIVCATGGNHSNELVSHLDYEMISRNPKIFQGYSDMTVLHWALLKHTGMVTFYGPSLVLEMAEYPSVLQPTNDSLRAAWFGGSPLIFDAAKEWTDEFLDWNEKTDLSRARAMRPNPGWRWLQQGSATGPLMGGCLETILWHIKGSAEWLDLSGAILFLETSEEAPSPAHVDAYLTDLANLGVLGQIAGLVMGRPMNYTADAAELLWQVVVEHTTGRAIPVLANIDCGHTDPMLTLPLGVESRLDSHENIFEATEAATSRGSIAPGRDRARR